MNKIIKNSKFDKVYVILEYALIGSEIVAIFSTKLAAKNFIKKLKKQNKGLDISYEIQDHDVYIA